MRHLYLHPALLALVGIEAPRPAPTPDVAVAEKAEELMRFWGQAAFDRASELSWREDAGLIQSPQPCYWWHVRGEIGRQLDRPGWDMRADFTPRPQAAVRFE